MKWYKISKQILAVSFLHSLAFADGLLELAVMPSKVELFGVNQSDLAKEYLAMLGLDIGVLLITKSVSVEKADLRDAAVVQTESPSEVEKFVHDGPQTPVKADSASAEISSAFSSPVLAIDNSDSKFSHTTNGSPVRRPSVLLHMPYRLSPIPDNPVDNHAVASSSTEQVISRVPTPGLTPVLARIPTPTSTAIAMPTHTLVQTGQIRHTSRVASPALPATSPVVIALGHPVDNAFGNSSHANSSVQFQVQEERGHSPAVLIDRVVVDDEDDSVGFVYDGSDVRSTELNTTVNTSSAQPTPRVDHFDAEEEGEVDGFVEVVTDQTHVTQSTSAPGSSLKFFRGVEVATSAIKERPKKTLQEAKSDVLKYTSDTLPLLSKDDLSGVHIPIIRGVAIKAHDKITDAKLFGESIEIFADIITQLSSQSNALSKKVEQVKELLASVKIVHEHAYHPSVRACTGVFYCAYINSILKTLKNGSKYAQAQAQYDVILRKLSQYSDPAKWRREN